MSEPRRRTELDLRAETVRVRAMIAIAQRDGRSDAVTRLRERRDDLDEASRRLAPTEQPLAELAAMFDLDEPQLDLWWTAIALTADPRLAIHAEALAGTSARRGLTVALFAQLFEIDDTTARALALWLAGPGPMLPNGLLLCQDEQSVLPMRTYAAPTRLVAHVAGVPHDDPRLVRHVRHEDHEFDASQRRTLASLGAVLAATDGLVVVEGAAGSGRTSAIASAAGRPVTALDVSDLSSGELHAALLALRREALISDTLPVIEQVDALSPDVARQLPRALTNWPTTLVLTTAMAGLDVGVDRPLVRFAWAVPDTATRVVLWRTLADAAPSAELDALALRYPVGPGAIARAVTSARLIAPEANALPPSALAAGLRHNIAERLGGVARRVEVTQSWDELVLADDIRDQVRTLIARLRHAHHVLDRWGYRAKLPRGGGVAALLSGPPGTGKTMVAGLVARELDLELYQVDLSQVVSKWVGETEKLLGRVFDAAEQGHALLLFDEADALFGQRTTETKGAVDRYANLEVNYLLQRVESFGGVTILTTNLDSAIDAALKRRLAAHIVFELPDEEEREHLWRRLVSAASAPLAADLDLSRLAREFPKMSGANIRNAALAAAFLAADDASDTITQTHLTRAARVEYRSMGHVLADRRA